MQAYLIKNLKDYEGQQVTLQGWASNRRDSKGIYFIILRDGTGWCQCVVSAESVSEEVFNECKKITTETSIIITGTVSKDEKQMARCS